MRILYKIILLTCLLFLMQVSAFGQVPGYKGKRFILKTDLASPILERGYNVELESILLRDLSIAIDYSQRSKIDYVDKYDVGDTASYTGNTVGLKIRSYLNKSVPGPIGVYSFLLGRYGTVDVDARLGPDSPYGQGIKTFEDMQYLQVGIGWGYQTLIKERISLDAGWTLLASFMTYRDSFPYDFYRGYGENLIFLSNALESYEDNWGISIHISVGVLLF